ncbi:MAG: hypothetical protein D9C04_07420, partial [Nitrosopumilus sp. B06]
PDTCRSSFTRSMSSFVASTILVKLYALYFSSEFETMIHVIVKKDAVASRAYWTLRGSIPAVSHMCGSCA